MHLRQSGFEFTREKGLIEMNAPQILLTRRQLRMLTWLQCHRLKDPSYISAIFGDLSVLVAHGIILFIVISYFGLEDTFAITLLVGVALGFYVSNIAQLIGTVRVFRAYKLVTDWEKLDDLLKSSGQNNKNLSGKWMIPIVLVVIAIAVIRYGSIFRPYAMDQGRIEQVRLKVAQGTIDALIPAIEMYKLTKGQYPDSLKELQESAPIGKYINVYEPSMGQTHVELKYFYYERIGQDHYYLRSVGPDGQPFTADDVIPHIPVGPNSKVGILVERVNQ